MHRTLLLATLLAWVGVAHSLDNGLARTPPMGWLAWERFRCNTDCVNDPDNCISERLFKTMADMVVSEGYAAVGYEYINVDDCWLSQSRDAYGRLQPDPFRFPSGIKALADYVHGKGLKFGIYEDYGNFTCAGYPGVLGHLQTDADTFADWDVDYVKLDGCYSHPTDMDRVYRMHVLRRRRVRGGFSATDPQTWNLIGMLLKGPQIFNFVCYPEFGYYLKQTGRNMVYSCSWPYYQLHASIQPNYTAIVQTCNLWRNYNDIQDSWESVQSIIDYYGDNQNIVVPNAGPGHWNDPDMLIIGNFGLSFEQSKTQMALWAIMAAPLLMSVDLRTIKPDYKAILQNRKVIGVDQDPLGIQGRRIYKHRQIEIWTRPVAPVVQGDYSYAAAFLNRRTDGTPSQVTVTLRELGLTHAAGYHAEDLFDNKQYEVLVPDSKIAVDVNPSGVVLLRFNALKSPGKQQQGGFVPGSFQNLFGEAQFPAGQNTIGGRQQQQPHFAPQFQSSEQQRPRARGPFAFPTQYVG